MACTGEREEEYSSIDVWLGEEVFFNCASRREGDVQGVKQVTAMGITAVPDVSFASS